MNNEKKLPENWGILGCQKLKKLFSSLPNNSFDIYGRLIGDFKSSMYTIKDGKWTEIGNNPKYFPEGFKEISFEEWDSIVNKKSIEFKTKEEVGEIEPRFIWRHPSPPSSPKLEERGGWDNNKVMGKRIEIDNNLMSPAAVINELSPPNKLNPFIVHKVDSIEIEECRQKYNAGAYSEDLTDFGISKQPKLKVGDKIPEYIDGKAELYHDDTAAGRKVAVPSNTSYYVHRIENDEYVCNPGLEFSLLISEVDALIEEHERESSDRAFFDWANSAAKEMAEFEKVKLAKEEYEISESSDWALFSNKNKVKSNGRTINNVFVGESEVEFVQNGNTVELKKELWEPKNGEEVGASLDIHPLNSVRGIYIGEDNGGYLIRRLSDNTYHTYDYVFRVPKKITVTHKEIAEWKGCDVEQLQIIKD